MIDLRYVKKLIDIIDGSTVDSIEISSDKGMKIRISKSPSQRGTVQMAAPVSMPALLPQADARVSPAQGIPALPAEAEAAPEASEGAVRSGSEVAHGRHLLRRARAGVQAVRRGGLARLEGADSSASSRR